MESTDQRPPLEDISATLNNSDHPSGDSQGGELITNGIRSLRELVDLVCGRNVQETGDYGEAGLAENLPYPFLALVGQQEMKLALMLSLINPLLGGVLLIGPRGTGKSTSVRSILELLPNVNRSLCFYGCQSEDVESGGIDAICPDCAKKYAAGLPLTGLDRVRLVELPLNAALADVVGGLDERALVHERLRLKRGLLAQADQNILYVDEVNLLNDEIVDAFLDAAASGSFTVRRGAISATYRARFNLIGSMNPEEGFLRPQIMDRFGLRVLVHGLVDPAERLEAYRRVRTYRINPRAMIAQYAFETQLARDEIQTAQELLKTVELPEEIARLGIAMVQCLKIDSLRAEITMFEAARAYAAADARSRVTVEDLQIVAPMSLRLRRSKFMSDYFKNQQTEEDELLSYLKAPTSSNN
jgi:magnesium chelatase subunit I